MKIKIYSKLCIDEKLIKSILPNASVSTPIMRDQLLKDVDQKFNIVAIIDGKFDQSLAVSPSEVMDALRAGVRVYGSSSMGALRAAETEKFGTIGHGKIFEFIKSSDTFRDDFLGQVFQDAGQKYKSYTYMDFYFSIQNLVTLGKVSSTVGKKLCAIYSKLYYVDRNFPALRHKISKSSKNNSELLSAAELVFISGFSQKKEDAIGLLKLIKEDVRKIKNVNAKFLNSAKKAQNPFDFYPSELFKI